MPLKDHIVQTSRFFHTFFLSTSYLLVLGSLRRGCKGAHPWDGTSYSRARDLPVRQCLAHTSDAAVPRRLQPEWRNRMNVRTRKKFCSGLIEPTKPAKFPLNYGHRTGPGSISSRSGVTPAFTRQFSTQLPSYDLSPLAARKQFIQTSL